MRLFIVIFLFLSHTISCCGDLDEIKKSSETGVIEAQFAFGYANLNGIGVEKNLKEAQIWLTKSAQGGLVEAQYEIGKIFKDGIGVPQNFDEAITYFRKASEQGHPIAQYWLGHLLNKVGSESFIESHMWLNIASINPPPRNLRSELTLECKGVNPPEEPDLKFEGPVGRLKRTGDYMKPLSMALASSSEAELEKALNHKYQNDIEIIDKNVTVDGVFQRCKKRKLIFQNEIQDLARKERDILGEKMTIEQLKEAQKRATEWWNSFSLKK